MPKEVTIHRYEPGHGKGGEHMGMEETPEGHWCAWEDVKALRDELATLRGLVKSLDLEEPLATQARLDQALGLWRYWRTHDITNDHEHWASFTNAVYDLLDGKPVPKRFVLAVEDLAKVRARPCPPPHPDSELLDAAIDLLVELGGAIDGAIAAHLLPGVTGKNARALSLKLRQWLAARCWPRAGARGVL